MSLPISAIATTVATLCATATGVAHAADTSADTDTQRNTVRIGEYHMIYNVSSTDISGDYTPPGLKLDAKDLDTLYVGYVRKLSVHFAAELVAGAPPVATTTGRGPATVGSVPYNGQPLAKVRGLAPTALVDYLFFDNSSAWRPYVGVGINYTTFFDRQSSSRGDQINGGPTHIAMTSSVGPVATMGLTWHPTRHLELNASYSVAKVSSTITTDTAGVERRARVDFLPTPLIFSIGYSF